MVVMVCVDNGGGGFGDGVKGDVGIGTVDYDNVHNSNN
jgi:hypothetical protein